MWSARATKAAVAMLPLCVGCTSMSAVHTGAGEDGSEAPKKIHITDRYGDRFDITHAVEAYGMSRHGFEYGIGKHAIRPINNPNMIGPGQPNYPTAWDDRRIIGARIEGENRSYPIRPLRNHEIVNEVVGETHLAVAY